MKPHITGKQWAKVINFKHKIDVSGAHIQHDYLAIPSVGIIPTGSWLFGLVEYR